MERFLNAIKAQAGALDQGQAQPRIGTITSSDPATATARVLLQPEAVLSGWLPVLSPWIGAGWGISCPPSPGDQVLVLAQEGDAEHGLIVGRAFSTAAPPPPAAAGELWLVHASGSSVKLLNDGTIAITGTNKIAITGNVFVSGDLHVAQNIYDQHGKLSDLRGHYNTHTHYDSRAGLTTIPNQQD